LIKDAIGDATGRQNSAHSKTDRTFDGLAGLSSEMKLDLFLLKTAGVPSLLQELDEYLLLKVNKEWSSPFLDQTLPAITDLHKNVFFVAAVLALFVFFIYKYRMQAVIFLFSLAATVGADDAFCGNVVKPIFSRLRPDRGHLDLIVRAPEFGGYSFPSNHAANMFCLATFLAYYFPRYRFLFFFCAVVVGYSRVYSAVHYPSDIIGGAVIGIIIGWIGAVICKRWIYRRSQKGHAHV
jgi:undecaprenyl-diphosphatase